MSSSSPPADGSEPINFRAALAAFQGQSQRRPDIVAPTPRSPRAPHPPSIVYNDSIHRTISPSSADPVERSSFVPGSYGSSSGKNNAFNNPFSPSSPTSQHTGVRRGMLSPAHAAEGILRKTESGTSLRDLSLQDRDTDSQRHRSQSLAEREASHGRLTPEIHSPGLAQGSVKQFVSAFSASTANRSTSPLPIHSSLSPNMAKGEVPPRPRGRLNSAGPRSATPTSHPSSPERRDSTASSASYASCEAQPGLQPPYVTSRKGSGSSTSSLPRLPPRPSTLAPSPAISEFGQITPKGEGVKRHAFNTAGGVTHDSTMSPPALPPRSATLGQAASDITNRRLGDEPPTSPYAVRLKSPLKGTRDGAPGTPPPMSTRVKPTPPPRPSSLSSRPWQGNDGGFRFGSGADQASVSSVNASAQPMLPQRPVQRSTHADGQQNGSHSTKRQSTTFTSISLSEDASHELRRTLDHSPHRGNSPAPNSPAAFHQPPPARGRPTHNAARPGSIGGGSVAPTGISSLLESAASALPIPLFKSASSTGMTSRALADGAPSKQGLVGTRGLGLHADSELTGYRPGQFLADRRSSTPTTDGSGEARMLARPVLLADARPAKPAKLAEPADDAARDRYEALYASLLAAQNRAKAKKGSAQPASNTSTLRGRKGDGATQDADTSTDSVRSVQSLRGWFEPGADATPPKLDQTAESTKLADGLSAKRVCKVWKRSRLPDTFMAEVWEEALTLQVTQKQGEAARGLHMEPFVRAMAALDAELLRRKTRAQAKAAKKAAVRAPARDELEVTRVNSNSSGRGVESAISDAVNTGVSAGRRLPPPPPS